jgi:hypothetical protein
MHPAAVATDLTAVLLSDDHDGVLVRATLRYDVSDPYAVHAVFATGSGPSVPWVFARELLTNGVFDIAGDGDVQVWRTDEPERHDVFIGLSSPDGRALLQVSGTALAEFLTRTYALCLPGDETLHLDTDHVIERLLAS